MPTWIRGYIRAVNGATGSMSDIYPRYSWDFLRGFNHAANQCSLRKGRPPSWGSSTAHGPCRVEKTAGARLLGSSPVLPWGSAKYNGQSASAKPSR